jgi:hypothetical protein
VAVTLNLNPSSNDVIQLDPQSESWLNVIRNNSGKQRPCAVPKQYFEILSAWGYVEGAPGAARLSPTGLALLLTEQNAEKAARKNKKH